MKYKTNFTIILLYKIFSEGIVFKLLKGYWNFKSFILLKRFFYSFKRRIIKIKIFRLDEFLYK